MNMAEARTYCLKLERDRERSWRESRQGAFEASMLSLDEHVAKIGEERPSICPKRPQGEAMGRNGHLQAGVLLQIEKSLRFA